MNSEQFVQTFKFLAFAGYSLCFFAACGGGGENNGCTTHNECDESSLCVSNTCTLAYGREYHFTVVSAQVSQYDPNGEAWDVPGGMPDPAICIYKNFSGTPASPNGALFCTNTIQDTFTATYNESFNSVINSSDSWFVVGFDEDLTDWELIGGCMGPITVDHLKTGGISCSTDYLISTQINITP